MLLELIKKWFTIQEPKKVVPPKRKPRGITLPKGVSPWVTQLASLGKKHGWKVIDWQGNLSMLSMWKDEVRLNVYTSTMTVATCLNHPKQGKTQLFRKNVTIDELEAIYQNPRIHTNKGYKKKGV